MSEILEVKNLKKYFTKKGKEIKSVDGVTFTLKKGETLGIVGESGSGKSTLARCIAKIINPTSGEILFNGKDILKYNKEETKEYRKDVQMIFQDPYSSLNPRMRCGEIIAEPLVNLTKLSKEEIKEKVLETMKVSGLSDFHYNRYPYEFSGGQRQRIGIARSLVINPEIIIADEPTSALDVSIQAQIINLLEDLKEKFELTAIFISHDLAVVEHVSDKVAVMYLGEIVEIGEVEQIFKNPLHPYTKVLIASIPAKDPFEKKEKLILKSDIQSQELNEDGCKFANRCPYAKDICFSKRPNLQKKKSGQSVSCHLVD